MPLSRDKLIAQYLYIYVVAYPRPRTRPSSDEDEKTRTRRRCFWVEREMWVEEGVGRV